MDTDPTPEPGDWDALQAEYEDTRAQELERNQRTYCVRKQRLADLTRQAVQADTDLSPSRKDSAG